MEAGPGQEELVGVQMLIGETWPWPEGVLLQGQLGGLKLRGKRVHLMG